MVRKASKSDAEKQAIRAARRERRREQSREEILDSAERVLTRDGVPGLTLEAVAEEVELTKAALYHYFASKDAILFEVIFRKLDQEATAIETAVAAAADGPSALAAIIEAMIALYAPHLEAFRLVYLQGQVAGPRLVQLAEEMLLRIRPINDRIYGGVEARLVEDRAAGTLREGVHPRRLAFLAHMAAIGLLTMKGMVESLDGPLVHGDDDLVGELTQAFRHAARST